MTFLSRWHPTVPFGTLLSDLFSGTTVVSAEHLPSPVGDFPGTEGTVHLLNQFLFPSNPIPLSSPPSFVNTTVVVVDHYPATLFPNSI